MSEEENIFSALFDGPAVEQPPETEAQKIARENREECNNASDFDREAFGKVALRLVYGNEAADVNRP